MSTLRTNRSERKLNFSQSYFLYANSQLYDIINRTYVLEGASRDAKNGMSVVRFSSFAPVTEMILQSLPAAKDKEEQKAPAIKNFDQLRQRLIVKHDSLFWTLSFSGSAEASKWRCSDCGEDV